MMLPQSGRLLTHKYPCQHQQVCPTRLATASRRCTCQVVVPRPSPPPASAAAVAATAARAAPAQQSTITTTSSTSSTTTDSPATDWRQLLISKALQPGQLVKLTLKAKIKGDSESVIKTAAGAGAAQTSEPAPSPAAAAADGAPSFLSSLVPAGSMPYKQLTMRPVLIKGKRLLQVSVLTARQDITKNFTDSQAAAELAQLLQLPWSSAALATATENVAVQVSRKGKALVQINPSKPQQQQQSQKQQQALAGSATSKADSSAQPSPDLQQLSVSELFGGNSSSNSQQQQPDPQQQVLISLQHDRVKSTPINGSVADAFLFKIGLQTADGKIRANMQAKFTQINEFLKLLVHTGELEQLGSNSSSSRSGVGDDTSSSSSSRGQVHVLDAGCGSSHLTFGTYHYLHNVMGLPVRLTGVDTNRPLMQRSNRACADLGIADVAMFHTAAIRDFPSLGLPAPDMVLALHACDTATDDALALGVTAGARIIMSVPCCQKDIQRQYQWQQRKQQGSFHNGSDGSGPDKQQQQQAIVQQVFEPLMDHGILKQRQLDLLTDTFRAQLLRLAGYRTDVVEFVSTEHTPRNLLIRAVKRRKPMAPAEAEKLAQQYVQLRDAWGVRPCLERLLVDSLPPEAVALMRGK